MRNFHGQNCSVSNGGLSNFETPAHVCASSRAGPALCRITAGICVMAKMVSPIAAGGGVGSVLLVLVAL
jgi:hypothetical protein